VPEEILTPVYDKQGYFLKEFILDQTLNDDEIQSTMVDFYNKEIGFDLNGFMT
jgi:hypothetical protein